MKFRVPNLKIGCTSFVIPDNYVPAVKKCRELADDIALLLLDAGKNGELLISKSEISELRHLADSKDEEKITWNIHLPANGDFATKQSTQELEDNILRAIELTLPLNPHTWVMHVADNTLLSSKNASYFNLEQTEMILSSLERISSCLPTPAHLALENLEFFPIDFLDDIISKTPYSRCFDIGHVWKDGLLPESFFAKWEPRIRMCHLHGLEKRDHKSLSHMPAERVDGILHLLWNTKFQGTITLEVFTLSDFLTSHQTILESYERYRISHP